MSTKELLRENSRRFYWRHRKQEIERSKKWNKENLEKVRRNSRKSYYKNKDRRKEELKNNPEKLAKKRAQWRDSYYKHKKYYQEYRKQPKVKARTLEATKQYQKSDLFLLKREIKNAIRKNWKEFDREKTDEKELKYLYSELELTRLEKMYPRTKDDRTRDQHYRERHPKRIQIIARIQRIKNRLKNNQYMRLRKKKNPRFHFNSIMSTAIYQSLKGMKSGRKWETLVGYTLKDLMKHLEVQFDEKMNWNNYGSYWWVDHKKPKDLFYFISFDDIEFKECWALKNLQPMEKIENIIKSNHF